MLPLPSVYVARAPPCLCSQYGYCGSTSAYCGTGCKAGFSYNGKCGSGGGGSGGGSSGGSVLSSGSGSGTYYYDVHSNYCPQDSNGYAENNGYGYCEPWQHSGAKTLAQEGTNNIVAIDANLLSANRAGLCGKVVKVFANGKQVSAPDGGDFFVWDGCQACIGGGRIDFSVSGLKKVNGGACDLGVVPGVTWQIMSTQAKVFVS